ncbi:MAG TPA: hypothetical protein VLA61_11570 [Ideonella sp.]|uniref:hypothetical protein n=1 Tax=Ideonella sp. TaxID=1929293 RepID=UPI002CFF6725|nr:hypothetical protein [Ideonella sp.]HSI48903.1 hypothetical protein [Ideonella sp.]
MTVHSLILQAHVLLSCGALLSWLAALTAHVAPWRRRHALIGKSCMLLVVASSVLAVGLAADSRNRFGMLFALQPLVLALSGAAQFLRSQRVTRALGVIGLLVAAAVLEGFLRLLATRQLVDVLAFAWTALTLAVLAAQDLWAKPGPAWRAHGHRMLAAGWFYLAELGIFVVDPHPSVIAWAVAAMLPVAAAWWMHRRPARTGTRTASLPLLSAWPARRQ